MFLHVTFLHAVSQPVGLSTENNLRIPIITAHIPSLRLSRFAAATNITGVSRSLELPVEPGIFVVVLKL